MEIETQRNESKEESTIKHKLLGILYCTTTKIYIQVRKNIFTILIVVTLLYLGKKKYLDPYAIENKILIPTELMNGDTIHMGDSFEYVQKVANLEDTWIFDTFRGQIPANNYYSMSKDIESARFNLYDELSRLTITVKDSSCVNKKIFFINTARLLIKYYGKPQGVYKWDTVSETYVLHWALSNREDIEMSGIHRQVDSNGENADSIVRISYNMGLSLEHYSSMKKKSLKSLGIE